jgi:hypothetical protein
MRSPTGKTAATKKAEPQVAKKRDVAEAMVDALEDILKWERASERCLRVAQATSERDLGSN